MRIATALRHFVRPPAPVRRQPPLMLVPPVCDDLPDGAEPYEFPAVPDVYGDRMPDLDAFADWWLGEMGGEGFRSIQTLRINYDAFARLHGYQPLTECQLSRLVPHSDRISKWRDRRNGNATRYRVVEP
jgi:hypothetical protein